MKKIFFILLLGLTGCSTTSTVKKAPENTQDILKPVINSEITKGLNYNDLLSLDSKLFLIEISSKHYKDKPKNSKGSLLVLNKDLKDKSMDLASLNLRHWGRKSLILKGYYVDSFLRAKTPIAIIYQFGTEPFENSSRKDLKYRYLKIVAVDYQEYKENKRLKALWEAQISSVGPKPVSEILHVLAAFMDQSIEVSHEGQRLLVSPEDPILEKTKDLPFSIDIESTKPSIEEIEFLNKK